jgi:hypothetical protein
LGTFYGETGIFFFYFRFFFFSFLLSFFHYWLKERVGEGDKQGTTAPTVQLIGASSLSAWRQTIWKSPLHSHISPKEVNLPSGEIFKSDRNILKTKHGELYFWKFRFLFSFFFFSFWMNYFLSGSTKDSRDQSTSFLLPAPIVNQKVRQNFENCSICEMISHFRLRWTNSPLKQR